MPPNSVQGAWESLLVILGQMNSVIGPENIVLFEPYNARDTRVTPMVLRGLWVTPNDAQDPSGLFPNILLRPRGAGDQIVLSPKPFQDVS